MEQSLSYEAKSLSGSSDFPHPLPFWGTRMFITIFTITVTGPILSQVNPFHNFSSYFFAIHWNTVLPATPRPSERSLFFTFPSQNRFPISLFSHICNNPRPSQPPRTDHPNNMWWKLKITNLLIMAFFPASCYFFPLTSKHVLPPVKSKSPLTLTSTCHALTIHKPTTKRGLNAEVVVLTPDSHLRSPRMYSWHLGRPVCRRIFNRQTPGTPWNYPQHLPSTTPTTDHNHPSTRRYTTYTAAQAFLKHYTSRIRRMVSNTSVITTWSYVLYAVDGSSMQLNTSRIIYVHTFLHTLNVEKQCSFEKRVHFAIIREREALQWTKYYRLRWHSFLIIGKHFIYM